MRTGAGRARALWAVVAWGAGAALFAAPPVASAGHTDSKRTIYAWKDIFAGQKLVMGSRTYSIEDLTKLDTPEEIASRQALLRLGRDPNAPRLAEHLSAPEVSMREMALDEIAQLGGPEYALKLVPLLTGDPEEVIRAKAALALSQVGSREEHAGFLARALGSDASSSVRATAAEGLLLFRATEDLPLLLERMLEDPVPGVRGTIRNGLISTWRPEGKFLSKDLPIDRIRRSLADRDPGIRVDALRTLSTLLTDEALKRALTLGDLEGLFGDPDERVRRDAIMMYGRLAVDPVTRVLPEPVGKRLVEFLRDPSPFVRAGAIQALQGVDAPYADRPLLARLESDSHTPNKQEAVKALLMNDARSMAPELLRIFLAHPVDGVRIIAAEGLRGRTWMNSWASGPQRFIKARGAEFEDCWLPGLGDPAVVGPEVFRLLDDPREKRQVRDAALRMILFMQMREGIPVAARLLDDPDPNVQVTAAITVLALGKGERDMVPGPGLVPVARAWWNKEGSKAGAGPDRQ